MKVTCQSCQAKYTIADEKVRGKVAKIRCKKCGTTIIVNGTEGAAGPSEHPVADYTHQGANTEQWTVLVGEGDQRTVVAAELTKLYLGGEINYETPAWKDGMAEWLPISQIDALRSVLDNGPQPTMTPFADHAPAASEPPPPEPVVPAPPMMNVAAAAPAAKPIGSRSKAFEPTAARRAGRGASTDLFGAPAQDEVLTSASANPVMHAPSDGGQDKLTGARNENSVLFSLSSLTGAPGGGGGPAPERASFDAGPVSSKADLRALVSSDTNGRPVQARSGLDDIMNLGGGGVYSPALMAPALAPPPVDFASAAETSMTGGAKPKSKTMLFAIIGVVLVGGAAFAYTSMNSSDKTGATASATPSAAAPTAEPTAAKAPEPTAAEPTAESAPTVLAPGQAAPKPEAEKKTAKAEKPDKPSAAPPAAAPAPAPDKPAAAPAPAAPAAASGADFDRAAALSALSAAASAAQSCKKPDGPTGSGKIAVTFANSGAATTAAVEGPPFAGTPVGGCVAARFRGVHVPPFGGATVTVHKTFIIN